MHNPATRNEMNQVEYVLGDWGTSRLRLFLMTDDAAAAYIEGPGIAALASHSPEQRLDVLSQLLASWSSPAGSSQVLLCGMAGARNGLVEVPYARLPLDSSKWLIGATTLQTQSLAITIAAGVCSCGPGSSVDVMRGEETQVFGAMQLDPDLGRGSHVLLLPGTHSKWILVSDGSIVRFRTAMTGELFALLREHSTLFIDDQSHPGPLPFPCSLINKLDFKAWQGDDVIGWLGLNCIRCQRLRNPGVDLRIFYATKENIKCEQSQNTDKAKRLIL